MNCKCGSLIVPNGSNCLLTLVDTNGQEVSAAMNHSVNAMVNDGRKLITYADIPAVSFNDQLRQVIVSFIDGRERIIDGKFRVYITYNDNIIASQYIGVKNDIYIIPNNKITMSCSNILDTISDDSRIFIMFESICDNSQDECCEDDNIDFELEDAIEFLCTVEEQVTTTTPEPLGYVLTDCDRGCESAPLSESEFSSFQLCAEQYQLLCTWPTPRTTTTTCDPNDPDCLRTTTPDPNLWNYSLQSQFFPSGDAAFIGDVDMSDNGDVIVFEDEFNATNPHMRVMKLNESCVWEQLGENINGDWSTVSITANGSGVVGSNNSDFKVYAYEWDGLNWSASGTPFSIGDGTSIGGSMVTYDGKHIVASNPDHGDGSASGTLEVHEWNGSDWTIKGASNEMLGNAGNRFSPDVCISEDGNTVLGCPSTSVSSPAVKAWEWNGSNWIQKGQIIYADIGIGELSQTDITMMGDGNRITIGCAESDDAPNGHSNAGSIKTYAWNSDTSNWDLSQTLFGSQTDSLLGNDSTSSMTRDGTLLLVSEPSYGKVNVLGWNGGGYVPTKSDSEVQIFDVENTVNWGHRTTISQNGKAFAATSISPIASGVCQIVQSNSYLCESVAQPTTPPPTTPAPTTTTTTTDAPVTDSYTVVKADGSSFGSEIEGGCYDRFGTGLVNGKYQYQLIEIDGDYGDYCNKNIVFTGGQWGIYLACDNDSPALVSSAPDNGALEPPLTGWTFGITLTPNCVD